MEGIAHKMGSIVQCFQDKLHPHNSQMGSLIQPLARPFAKTTIRNPFHARSRTNTQAP